MEEFGPVSEALPNFAFMNGLILDKVLLEDIGEVAEIPEFLEVSVDCVQLLNFLPFEFECLVYLQGQI